MAENIKQSSGLNEGLSECRVEKVYTRKRGVCRMILGRRTLQYVFVVLVIFLFADSAFGGELQLAGVRLGRSALTVLQKYGNPTDIKIGAAREVETSLAVPSPVQPTGAMPSGPGATAPSSPLSGVGLPGMLPPAGPSGPGSTFPFGTSPAGPAQPQFTPTTTTVRTVAAPEVTWIYQFTDNRRLEFLLSPDGRVVQISAFGVSWPGVSTSKGIRLGHTYKDIIFRYGYPQSQEQSGLQLVVKYPETHRVLFTLLGKSVVGITIALMD